MVKGTLLFPTTVTLEAPDLVARKAATSIPMKDDPMMTTFFPPASSAILFPSEGDLSTKMFPTESAPLTPDNALGLVPDASTR